MQTNPAKELILAPVPRKITHKPGVFDAIGAKYIKLDAVHPEELVPAARQTGLGWEVTASPKTPKSMVGLTIHLRDSGETEPEGYKLNIKPDGIEIIAVSPVGAFHGACTLKQILRQIAPVQTDAFKQLEEFGHAGERVWGIHEADDWDAPDQDLWNTPQEDILDDYAYRTWSLGEPDYSALPCLSISDWPDFPNRGIMLDISRDKVPTMKTLFRLVDLMAEWKLNQLQLYTEHTFAYLAHPIVWQDADPMTGEEIMQLDAYCKSKFIELVPNQNSFGHMEGWLKYDEYRPMAEQPNGGETAWGYREIPGGLCPIDKRSIPFLAGLYDELLPHFTSGLFNVGLDETVDLGYGRSKSICKNLGAGRVYLDFLLKIHELASGHGRQMMFWGDIIMHYPDLIPELPRDIIALEWGYEFDHPFAEHGAKFAASGVPFYVCPGASNWNTYSGRTNNAIGNITLAAKTGLANGAVGMLNTSWGDNGHWDPLPVAYTGFMAGAMASWNAKADVKKILADALSLHAFNDISCKIGRAFFDLGNVYTCFKKRTWNSSIPWQMLHNKIDNEEVIEGLTMAEFKAMDAEIDRIAASIECERMTAPDAEIVDSELGFVISMLRFASAVGKMRLGGPKIHDLDIELSATQDHHRWVWQLRNRPGGLQDSAEKIL